MFHLRQNASSFFVARRCHLWNFFSSNKLKLFFRLKQHCTSLLSYFQFVNSWGTEFCFRLVRELANTKHTAPMENTLEILWPLWRLRCCAQALMKCTNVPSTDTLMSYGGGLSFVVIARTRKRSHITPTFWGSCLSRRRKLLSHQSARLHWYFWK